MGKQARERRLAMSRHKPRARLKPVLHRSDTADDEATWTASPNRPDKRLAQLAELVDARRDLTTKIDGLLDELVDDGVSWPVIANVLGVTRQAARQAHTRRHATDA